MDSLPAELLNVLVACLVTLVGWNVRQLMKKFDEMDGRIGKMERRGERNTIRLVRIETRLGVDEPDLDFEDEDRR